MYFDRRRKKVVLVVGIVLLLFVGGIAFVVTVPNGITRAMHYQPGNTKCTAGATAELSPHDVNIVNQQQQRYWLEPYTPKEVGGWMKDRDEVLALAYFFPMSCGYVATTFSYGDTPTGFGQGMIYTRDGRTISQPSTGICISNTLPYVTQSVLIQGCDRIMPLGSAEAQLTLPVQ